MSLNALRSRLGTTRRNYERSKLAPGLGHSFTSDIKARLPALKVKTIFDVGANIGVLALEFADEFPDATVHAFEPGEYSYKRMDGVLVGKPSINRHKVALSSNPGKARLLVEPDHPTMARITNTEGADTEQVEVDTVDRFCATNGIRSIEVMKIDTEGHELNVLAGATAMLSQGAISIIKSECTADPENTFHTQFSDICNVLHPLGYKIFAIYDQSENPLQPTPALQRFDVAFISPVLAKWKLPG